MGAFIYTGAFHPFICKIRHLNWVHTPFDGRLLRISQIAHFTHFSHAHLHRGCTPFRHTLPIVIWFIMFLSWAPKSIVIYITNPFLVLGSTTHHVVGKLPFTRAQGQENFQSSFGSLPLVHPRNPIYASLCLASLFSWALSQLLCTLIQNSIFCEGAHVHQGHPLSRVIG